jgi:flagellar basal-body rod protein FlgB
MADNIVDQFLLSGSAPTVVLKKSLDAQAMRQRAHAQNIANAETPGYKRVAVDFEEQLKSALSQRGSGTLTTGDPQHMTDNETDALANVQAVAREETPDGNSPGVNGVDIDQEMSQMAETQLRYMASLELLKRRYTSLKMAIKGQ